VRCACVDIGSNTTRLLVAGAEEGRVAPVHAERAFVRLAGAAAGGSVDAEMIELLARVVARQAVLARSHGARVVHVVGTAALRQAANRAALTAAVREVAGVEVRILEAEEEARLTFAGALAALPAAPEGPVGVVDVGGGSSELVVGTAQEGATWTRSLPVGSGLLTERYLRTDPPAADELEAVRTAVAEAFAGPRPPGRLGLALAVGGSAISVARLAGGELDAAGLDRALAALCREPAGRVAARTGLHRERVRLLPAGLLLLSAAADAFAAPLQVVAGGLREGVILHAARGAWP
jgi:exopolyphosphatase/guanosine-5'-triphosphate,3'-diphosphate pyrophosphatase